MCNLLELSGSVSVLDMQFSASVGLVALMVIMLRGFGPTFHFCAPEQDWSE